MLWDRIEVLLPVFDHPAGLETSWYGYKVVSTMLHRGVRPDHGHYVAGMFTSLGYLMADDDLKPWTKSVIDNATYDDCYLIWLVRIE